MNQSKISFFAGFIFAIGLGVAGMTQPQKVLGFLNVLNNWDASLIFVMAAAVLVSAISYYLIRKLKKPIYADHWSLPIESPINLKLVGGAILFGLGWGLAGYCPGPALVSLITFKVPIMIFVASMCAGMFLFRLTERDKK